MSIQIKYDVRVTCDSCDAVVDVEKWAHQGTYGILDGRGVAPELAQIGWKVKVVPGGFFKGPTMVETLCPLCVTGVSGAEATRKSERR